MRFAIATVDRYLGVFEAFVRAGWEPVKLFTVPVSDALNNHQMVAGLAQQHGAPVQFGQPSEGDLLSLKEQGCEALIVACYPWKIRDWRPFLKYGVNFHCSPLPEGRGPYPVHRAILENRSLWAVSCHQLSPEFDRGDILAAEHFSIEPDECHDRLDLKIQMASKRLAYNLAGHFADFWENATPQSSGAYWPQTTLKERVIDFGAPVESILRHVRAFGATESLAQINEGWISLSRAVGWVESHKAVPGQVVHVSDRAIVVAALDGFVGMMDVNVPRPEVVAELQGALLRPITVNALHHHADHLAMAS